MPMASFTSKIRSLPVLGRLRPPSMVNSLILIMLVNLVVIVILGAVGFYSFKISKSARSYTNMEGIWSRAEKAAVISLLRYAQTGDEAAFNDFSRHIEVTLGDKSAHEELKKQHPDLEVARSGLEQGLNRPDEIDDLIWLHRFQHTGYGERIIDLWDQQDRYIDRLFELAQEVRGARRQTPVDPLIMEALITQAHSLDHDLTILETEFSDSLGEATRDLNSFIFFGLLSSGLTFFLFVMALSSLLALRLRSGITKLKNGAKRLADGDYQARVTIRQRNELGELADDFNWMARRLEDAIGEVRASEEILRQSQADLRRYSKELKRSNEDLEQFAYVVSHDLQEPIRTVSKFSELLAKRYRSQLDEKANELITFIIDDTDRMQKLINDLLAYSRVTTMGREFEPVDSGTVLKQVTHILERPIEESGAVITATDLPVIKADETQLGQLLQNLLANAIKFRGEEPPRVYIEAREQPDAWLFSVKDEGIGIAPADHERIFQVFQRMHPRGEYPGTGIGLAICKRIVERHGGDIWVESEEGKGATFFFTIPK